MAAYHNDPQGKSSMRNLDKRLWKEVRSYLAESGFDVKTWNKSDFLNNRTILVSLGSKIFTLSIRGTNVSDLEFKGPESNVIVTGSENLNGFIDSIRKYIERLREKHDERIKGMLTE